VILEQIYTEDKNSNSLTELKIPEGIGKLLKAKKETKDEIYDITM
jgi:hypothetical protein